MRNEGRVSGKERKREEKEGEERKEGKNLCVLKGEKQNSRVYLELSAATDHKLQNVQKEEKSINYRTQFFLYDIIT